MRSVKLAFKGLVGRLVSNVNTVLSNEQTRVTKKGKEFNLSKEEQEMIEKASKLKNDFNAEISIKDEKRKHTIYLRPDTNDRLSEIKAFIRGNYGSTIKETDLSVNDTLDFMINSYYITIFYYKLYIHENPEQVEEVSFDQWLMDKLTPLSKLDLTESQKKKHEDKYMEQGAEIKKDTSMLKSMVNNIYYLLLNKYLKDEDYVEKDEFLRVGTTENKLSQIAKIDTEVKKVSRQQFIDKRRREMLLNKSDEE